MHSSSCFEHKNFFSLSLREIINLTGATFVIAEKDMPFSKNFIGISALENASSQDISFFQCSFLENVNYKSILEHTQTGICFIEEKHVPLTPKTTIALVTPSPLKAIATVAKILYPEKKSSQFIHPNAIIHPNATIGKGCYIDAGAVIEENVCIGNSCYIGANAIIQDAFLGNNCEIGAKVAISYAKIGNNVVIKNGACIGQKGFGFGVGEEMNDIPHLGHVIIEDHVQIGANTTIDRGTFNNTRIGVFTRIDNLVQIAHNVTIGKKVIIAALVGIAGSCHIDDECAIGGQVGIAGHVYLAPKTRVAAKSGVIRSTSMGEIIGGIPAIPIKKWRQQVVRNWMQNK